MASPRRSARPGAWPSASCRWPVRGEEEAELRRRTFERLAEVRYRACRLKRIAWTHIRLRYALGSGDEHEVADAQRRRIGLGLSIVTSRARLVADRRARSLPSYNPGFNSRSRRTRSSASHLRVCRSARQHIRLAHLVDDLIARIAEPDQDRELRLHDLCRPTSRR